MIGLSYKQKCNNFGYHSIEVRLKGNDKWLDQNTLRQIDHSTIGHLSVIFRYCTHLTVCCHTKTWSNCNKEIHIVLHLHFREIKISLMHGICNLIDAWGSVKKLNFKEKFSEFFLLPKNTINP